MVARSQPKTFTLNDSSDDAALTSLGCGARGRSQTLCLGLPIQ
jgi:hypothetical protein